MRSISLLDCTLRDGGYVNHWNFGYGAICAILEKLCASNVEYIECGYLSETKGGDENCTQFRDFEALSRVLPRGSRASRFAVMIDYGQYRAENIPDAGENAPVLRVCFHKKDVDGALSFCARLMEKGYTVFVQPMASLNYSDVEFVGLIERVNAMNPACFYIVDSFGVIEIEDFQRILFIADHNLKKGIILGYHAHNNLQQAYGNAKYMAEQNLTHDIMIDASVYGMGRGAGNLNMELFASYLNKRYDKNYNIDAFLDIMDQYLKPVFSEHYWGYSLPFYLSARYNCHPNYAGYFADKNTMSNKSMKELLASLPADVKMSYSRETAERLYGEFQRKYIDDAEAVAALKREFAARELLILAPGKSLREHRKEILAFIEARHPVVIAINVLPAGYSPDYVFCSNEKRLSGIRDLDRCRLIASSNIEDIPEGCRAIRINYSSYLGEADSIADNPTLMVIRLLIQIGVSSVSVAGFDGYSANPRDNYFDEKLSLGTSLETKLQKNEKIKRQVRTLGSSIDIRFLTPSMYR